MKLKTIKYAILVLLGALMLYQFIPIGNYCDGLLNGLLFLVLGGVLLLVFLITVIYDSIKSIKHKQRFDFIPLVIFIVIVGCNYSLLKTDNKKFWTTEALVGDIENNHYSRTNRIILYKNNSFAITRFNADIKCTIQGNYTIIGDTLNLDKEDLGTLLTDKIYTSHYIISKNDSTLISLDTTFKNIHVSRVSKDFY